MSSTGQKGWRAFGGEPEYSDNVCTPSSLHYLFSMANYILRLVKLDIELHKYSLHH